MAKTALIRSTSFGRDLLVVELGFASCRGVQKLGFIGSRRWSWQRCRGRRYKLRRKYSTMKRRHASTPLPLESSKFKYVPLPSASCPSPLCLAKRLSFSMLICFFGFASNSGEDFWASAWASCAAERWGTATSTGYRWVQVLYKCCACLGIVQMNVPWPRYVNLDRNMNF